MESLRISLRRSLKDAERVAILAIGSSLRGDDAAGLEVAERLRRIRMKPRTGAAKSAIRSPQSAIRIFVGETAPENLTGEIKKFRPTHLVLLDAADAAGKKPGAISLIRHDLLRGGSSISTHNMPVNVLIQYIQQSVPCKVLILGIQPKSHEFGAPLSAPVKKAAEQAAAALAAALGANAQSKPPKTSLPKIPSFHCGPSRVNVADRGALYDFMER
jgi:hydrogenase maturation protease HycI